MGLPEAAKNGGSPPVISNLRDVISSHSVLIVVAVLAVVAFSIAELTPGTTPSTVLLASAAGSSALDAQCIPSYDYTCLYPNKDKEGKQCGQGFKVTSAQVRGHCLLLYKAQDDQVLNSDGQWVSPQLPQGVPGLGQQAPSDSQGTQSFGSPNGEPLNAPLEPNYLQQAPNNDYPNSSPTGEPLNPPSYPNEVQQSLTSEIQTILPGNENSPTQNEPNTQNESSGPTNVYEAPTQFNTSAPFPSANQPWYAPIVNFFNNLFKR
jgi:hypothetical protein